MEDPLLVSGIAKMAMLGQRAGFTVEEMIRILNGGFTVEDLLQLIEGRLEKQRKERPAS